MSHNFRPEKVSNTLWTNFQLLFWYFSHFLEKLKTILVPIIRNFWPFLQNHCIFSLILGKFLSNFSLFWKNSDTYTNFDFSKVYIIRLNHGNPPPWKFYSVSKVPCCWPWPGFYKNKLQITLDFPSLFLCSTAFTGSK